MREALSKSLRTKTKSRGKVTVKATKSRSGNSTRRKATARNRIKGFAKKRVKAVRARKAKPLRRTATAKKSVRKKKIAARSKKRVPKKAIKGKARGRKTASKPSKSKVKTNRKAISRIKRVITRRRTQKMRAKKSIPAVKRKISIPIVVSPPLHPEPSRRHVSSAVLRAFEHAVKVFNRRQYPEAKQLFENLQNRFPNEVEIIARVQTYLQVCKQKLSRSPLTPRDADELYDRGVFALNIGDFPQARTFFEKALRLRPDEPHLLYSLAATHAQTGSHDQALDFLKRSIQIQPRFRSQALNDMDFSMLRENKRFLEMLGLTSPFERLTR
jgi:tetratricopeptide (TPR) repeat protein